MIKNVRMPTQPGTWTKSLFGVSGPRVGRVTLQQEGPNHKYRQIFKLYTNLQTSRDLINPQKSYTQTLGTEQ